MKTVVVPYKDAATLVDVMMAGLVVPSLAATCLFIPVTFPLIVDVWERLEISIFWMSESIFVLTTVE